MVEETKKEEQTAERVESKIAQAEAEAETAFAEKPIKKKGFRDKLKYLDPFTYVDFLLNRVNPFPEENLSHQIVDWIVYLFFGLIFAFILYSVFGFALSTSSPMVIVVSPSMEPTLYRGDIVFLQGASAKNINAKEISLPVDTLNGVSLESVAEVVYDNGIASKISFKEAGDVPITADGDIIVYMSNVRKDFPVIHRVIAKIQARDGYYFLTKGDNRGTNNVVDQDCKRAKCIHTSFVQESEIQGKALFVIPKLGCIKLLLFEGRC